MNQGKPGKPFRVITNSFAITRLPDQPFYHYDVVITKKGPTEDKDRPCPKARCAEIIDKLQDAYPQIFTPKASYDGYKNLFCLRKFEDGKYPVQVGPATFEISITGVSTIQTADLMRLTTPEGAVDLLAQRNTIPVTLLQVIISQAPHRAHNFSLHAKSFYEERNFFELSGGLQGWKGYFQSVRPVLGKFIVNVNTTAAAFYNPGNLLETAVKVAHCRSKRELIEALHDPASRAFDEIRRFYKGVAVAVLPKGVRKKITGFVKMAGRHSFKVNETPTTVAEYWAEHHHITLQFPDAFGIQVGYSDAVFPAEVCKVVAGQRYKKKLSPEDTATFISETKTRPADKLRDITNAVAGQPLNYAGSSWMKEAGIVVSARPVTAPARILPPPGVKYNAPHPLEVDRGAWNVMRQALVRPARINRWVVVVFDHRASTDRVKAFVGHLKENMRKLGMSVNSEPLFSLGGPNVAESLKQAVLDSAQGLPFVQDSSGRSVPPFPSFILVVLPRDALDLRKEVKQWGDLHYGIPTQCVRGGKYESNSDQYCNNVALKINARIGGENNHALPKNPGIARLMDGAMFVGCDVTHPAPGVTNRPSVATLVASMDKTATKYNVYVSVQMPRQEIISDMANMLHRAIEDRKAKEGAYPAAVVVYRDGVSEGEYAKVTQEEIAQNLAMLEQAYKRNIHLVFIVVGKRHNNRFFPEDRAFADRSGNIPAGSVIDTEIVQSRYIDFFLCSHSGIIGTSRPAHYVVLANTANASASDLQELSYTLCHVYASATRSVSIPAPVYYADRVCARVADFQFNPTLFQDDSTTDGGGETQIDLEQWRKGLALSKLSMYFL